MASFKIKKNTGKYRIRFTLDGKEKEMLLPTADKRVAETVCGMVERLVEQKQTGEPNRLLSNWLKEIPDDLRQRLERAGLVEESKRLTVAELYKKFLESKPDSPKTTLTAWGQAYRNLIDYLKGDSRRIDTITIDEAIAFKAWLPKQEKADRPKSKRKKPADKTSNVVYGRSGVKGTLSPSTAGRRLGFVKQWFQFAVSRGWLERSPFENISAPVPVNPARQYFISQEESEKILEACPNQRWRALFVLSRYIGIRIPSELYTLKWSDVHFSDPSKEGEAGRGFIYIHDQKRKHHGDEMALRRSPLWANVERELIALYNEAKEGEEFLFPEVKKSSNLRTDFVRIVKRAGVEVYPKIFHNLRSSCETEYERAGVKPTVYCRWLGNSPQIAVRHYVQYGEEDFQTGYSIALNSGIIGQDSQNLPGILPGQVGILDNLGLQAGGKKIPQTPENQGFLQERKKPCDKTQGVKMDVNSIERNHEKPLFLGAETGSADGRCPEFCPDCDKIELILSLIDSLTFEEKERLFDRLDSVER